jgi:hypothetical protein
MKHTTIAIAFIMASFYCFGQMEQESINFLETLIRTSQAEGQIIYTDKINSVEIYKVKLKLDKNTVTGTTNDTRQNSIILTRKERIYLQDQLEALANPYWNENLFPNSKLIKEEDLLSYFKGAYQAYSENLSNPNNSESDKSNLIKNYQQPSVFEFSNPIYLRDNSICLVYMMYLCGNPCGTKELCFYKKENNKWGKWIVVGYENY